MYNYMYVHTIVQIFFIQEKYVTSLEIETRLFYGYLQHKGVEYLPKIERIPIGNTH